MSWCNLTAMESGLEYACVNSDDFTVLVSKQHKHHWVSMCTVWLSHSKWLSEWMCQILSWNWTFLCGNYSDDSEGFWGWCNECGTNKSVAQRLQRWLRVCWKWSTFWKACNKENTWECWTCTGCNQQGSVTDSVRTRSWSGDSQNYCVQDFDAGSWHEMCHGKIHSMASATRAERTCINVANDLIQTTTNEPDFLKKVITRDESWVYSYDLERKAQSSQWKSPGSPHPKKVQ